MNAVCGIDEAGRGALAGPLVAAAVVLTNDQQTTLKKTKLKIRDSKKLTFSERLKVYSFLKSHHIFFTTEIVSTRKINNRGIGRANKQSIKNLIRRIEADQYIVDGNLKLGRVIGKTPKIRCIIDADAIILPVILAGIVAKVTRDRLMHELHVKYAQYQWQSNSGYGTRTHIAALLVYGPTRYHRNIFVTSALRKTQYRGTNVTQNPSSL